VPRIIAGRAGGLQIAAPPVGTRPTSDRVREALFSTLESFGGVQDRVFLDCYAGSGAVGLEAWSRGAARVIFVESSATAVRALRANVTRVRAVGAVEIHPRDAAVVAQELAAGSVDVLFADPPYLLPAAKLAEVLRSFLTRGVLTADAVVIVERSRRDPWQWPTGLEALQERHYGETALHYARLARDGSNG
jgi:16S rRNA (guanine966-N2)-methyltransferase